MKSVSFRLVHLLLFFLVLKVILLSGSSDEDEDDFDFNLKENSSDDEDSVSEDNDADISDEFSRLNLDDAFFWKSDKSEPHKTENNSTAKPLSCIDHKGQEVDWWFAYKEPGGLRYLYLSSLAVERQSAKKKIAKFRGLDEEYLIDDPKTSPVLKTIYQTSRVSDSNDVWLGWNDDPHDKFDAYGAKPSSLKNAHSKGFYAQNAILGRNDSSVIGSYAILTSLPRFPVVENGSSSFGSAIKNVLPSRKKDIFDSNLSVNAQHFMCFSFPREKAKLETVENVQEIVVPSHRAAHINFLTEYLKTIHPTIVGTNFSDWNRKHRIWRRYFSLLKYPAPKAKELINENVDLEIDQLSRVYSKPDLPSLGYVRETPNPRVFPLASSPLYYDAKRNILWSEKLLSRWDEKFAHQNGCIDGDESVCLKSFKLETTRLQYSLSGVFFAKHCMVKLDLFDDWATLQVAESQKEFENTYTKQTVDRYGLLVQSWIDSRTILPRNPGKKIYDENENVIAKVIVDNVSHYDMPYRVNSSKDHSKWAISFTLDSFNSDYPLEENKPSFNPLFFLSDLNRATTQVCLKGKHHGRGGGIVAISNISLWNAMMNLKPRSLKPRFFNSGKVRTQEVQNRLRAHIRHVDSELLDLPVVPLRKFTFHSLRLCRKEAMKPMKAANFIQVLSEISQFIKQAEFKDEHLAIAAFQSLFRSLSTGNVIGAAKRAWEKITSFSQRSTYLIDLPQLFPLPSLHIYRTVNESHEDCRELRQIDLLRSETQLIINKKTGAVLTGDIVEIFRNEIHKLLANRDTILAPTLEP